MIVYALFTRVNIFQSKTTKNRSLNKFGLFLIAMKENAHYREP